MTEYGHDVVDGAAGVDRGVGPGGDYLSDCVADNDYCDVACGFVEVAAEVVCCAKSAIDRIKQRSRMTGREGR